MASCPLCSPLNSSTSWICISVAGLVDWKSLGSLIPHVRLLPKLYCWEVGRGWSPAIAGLRRRSLFLLLPHFLTVPEGTPYRPWMQVMCLLAWVPFTVAPVMSQMSSVDHMCKGILLTACEVGLTNFLWPEEQTKAWRG